MGDEDRWRAVKDWREVKAKVDAVMRRISGWSRLKVKALEQMIHYEGISPVFVLALRGDIGKVIGLARELGFFNEWNINENEILQEAWEKAREWIDVGEKEWEELARRYLETLRKIAGEHWKYIHPNLLADHLASIAHPYLLLLESGMSPEEALNILFGIQEPKKEVKQELEKHGFNFPEDGEPEEQDILSLKGLLVKRIRGGTGREHGEDLSE